jgi:transcriptional antiterminator
MAANTRSAAQREQDLGRVAELYLRGSTQGEIARQLGVSRQQISYDLKVLQKRWQEAALHDFNARKAQELAKVDELERAYWQAWQDSKRVRETTTTATEKTSGSEAADPEHIPRCA